MRSKHLPIQACLVAFALLAYATAAPASVALLMEEPYGAFGAFNPTGHAAIYLNRICAASPTELRPCRPGELGAVISRYHKIHHEDWIAMPLVPYLYAVDDISQIPNPADRTQAGDLRASYWRAHLQTLAPAKKDGSPPAGEWDQLVGQAYLRRIHGFQVDTTPEQDQHLIAYFNDRRNVGHFNLFFHNCADFSRALLDLEFPGSIHRSFLADLGLTTPKQVAKSLVQYGNKHPELHMTAFLIPQVPGSISRSHPVDGVAESLVKSKKYLLPLVILQPEVAGVMVVGYLAEGRMRLPKDATLFQLGDEAQPAPAALKQLIQEQPTRTPPPEPPKPPVPCIPSE